MLSKTYTKYIQSLHHKKFRDEEGVFIAEGIKVVKDLLDSDKFICKKILAVSDWLKQDESSFLKKHSDIILEIESFELEKISVLATPNKILAVFSKAEMVPFAVKDKITLVLDTIQDPGNLGTIIRIADWFGVENIICSDHSADMYNPKVVQSTMGSLARVNIIYTDLIEWLASQNDTIKIYAATLHGKDVKGISGIKEAVIIIGNESKGINEQLLSFVHEKITIARVGKAESLNAAVATGIILSHI